MALLTIEEPDPAGPGGAAIRWTRRPLWALGFRPFYLLAAGFAALAIPAWLAAYYGLLPRAARLNLLWHLHEMVFGMAVAVVIGFLYTAGRNWTSLWTPRNGRLALLAALWVAGRLAMLAGADAGAWAALVDAAFLPLATLPLWRVLHRAGNRRNYVMVLLLGVLGTANLCWHAAVLGWAPWSPMVPLHAAIFTIVLMEAVIGMRVLPMFTRNGAPGSAPVVRPWLDRAGLVCTVAASAGWVAGLPAAAPGLTAALAGAAGLLTLARLAGWQPLRTLRVPLLWVLHLSYAWIGAGFLLLAGAALGLAGTSAAFHALAVGSMGGLIIGMMCRTSLGHTGRALKAGRAEVTMFAAIQLAAVARVAASLDVAAAWRDPALVGAAAAWTAAFGLFVLAYRPKLCAARLDGKAG